MSTLASSYTDQLFNNIPEINVLDVIYRGVADGEEENVSAVYIF